MKLLFKRDQARGVFDRPIFRLWCQIEFEDDEVLLLSQYSFRDAILVDVDQPGLLRNSALVGVFTFFAGIFVFGFLSRSYTTVYTLSALSGIFSGWFFYDRFRETISVRDLIHGRYFQCRSIIDLARKEHYLGHVTSYFRQVLETAKHWGDTEPVAVEPLSKGEAKLAVIRGI